MSSVSGSGNIDGWAVEGRSPGETRVFNEQLFDEKWRDVVFHKSPIGVPRGWSHHLPWYELCGLYSWEAANALRWWFHAHLAAVSISGGIETRLVKHEIKYSYDVTRIGSTELVDEAISRRWHHPKELGEVGHGITDTESRKAHAEEWKDYSKSWKDMPR